MEKAGDRLLYQGACVCGSKARKVNRLRGAPQFGANPEACQRFLLQSKLSIIRARRRYGGETNRVQRHAKPLARSTFGELNEWSATTRRWMHKNNWPRLAAAARHDGAMCARACSSLAYLAHLMLIYPLLLQRRRRLQCRLQLMLSSPASISNDHHHHRRHRHRNQLRRAVNIAADLSQLQTGSNAAAEALSRKLSI